jgi:hypothetical protein
MVWALGVMGNWLWGWGGGGGLVGMSVGADVVVWVVKVVAIVVVLGGLLVGLVQRPGLGICVFDPAIVGGSVWWVCSLRRAVVVCVFRVGFCVGVVRSGLVTFGWSLLSCQLRCLSRAEPLEMGSGSLARPNDRGCW